MSAQLRQTQIANVREASAPAAAAAASATSSTPDLCFTTALTPTPQAIKDALASRSIMLIEDKKKIIRMFMSRREEFVQRLKSISPDNDEEFNTALPTQLAQSITNKALGVILYDIWSATVTISPQ